MYRSVRVREGVRRREACAAVGHRADVRFVGEISDRIVLVGLGIISRGEVRGLGRSEAVQVIVLVRCGFECRSDGSVLDLGDVADVVVAVLQILDFTENLRGERSVEGFDARPGHRQDQ